MSLSSMLLETFRVWDSFLHTMVRRISLFDSGSSTRLLQPPGLFSIQLKFQHHYANTLLRMIRAWSSLSVAMGIGRVAHPRVVTVTAMPAMLLRGVASLSQTRLRLTLTPFARRASAADARVAFNHLLQCLVLKSPLPKPFARRSSYLLRLQARRRLQLLAATSGTRCDANRRSTRRQLPRRRPLVRRARARDPRRTHTHCSPKTRTLRVQVKQVQILQLLQLGLRERPISTL